MHTEKPKFPICGKRISGFARSLTASGISTARWIRTCFHPSFTIFIGQQISTKAQATIWQRMQDALGQVNAETILAAGVPKLQGLGMTFRKAEYITDFAEKVRAGAFDLDAVEHMSDEDAIRELSSLKGIGVWTAEMILLFCMQRPDIFSYDDLAIQRGLRMVYHHRSIDRRLFEKYRRRFHPYCSVASLYLWAVSGGAIQEMKDYKPKNKNAGSF